MMKTIYFAFFIHFISASDIWYYPADQTSTDWEGITVTQTTADPVCPGPTNDNCWDLNTQGSIERIVNTTGYSSVEFTWFMSTGTDLNGAGKSCDIHYSLDGTGYTLINTITSKNQDQTNTYNTWAASVDDTTGLRIRLSNTAGGYACYFNDLRLFGATFAPTNNPSSAPTTNDPTTAIPSTSPITAAPSSSPSGVPSGSPTVSTTAPSASPTSITSNPSATPSSSPTQTPSVIWSDDMSSDALWSGTHSGMNSGTIRFDGGDDIYRTTDVSDFYFIYVVSSITKWSNTLEPGEYIHLQYQIDGLLSGWIEVETWDVDQLPISNYKTYLPSNADFNSGLSIRYWNDGNEPSADRCYIDFVSLNGIFVSSAPTTSLPTTGTSNPTPNPSTSPTSLTSNPTKNPSVSPTKNPSVSPTNNPSLNPTASPSKQPTTNPSSNTANPSVSPTKNPSDSPTNNPSISPTSFTSNPTKNPSISPSKQPTPAPITQPQYWSAPVGTGGVTSWSLAVTYCAANNAQLATFRTVADIQAMKDACNDAGSGQYCYTGWNDPDLDKACTFIDGSQMDDLSITIPWASGQPGSSSTTTNCGCLKSTNYETFVYIYDCTCSHTSVGFVCETLGTDAPTSLTISPTRNPSTSPTSLTVSPTKNPSVSPTTPPPTLPQTWLDTTTQAGNSQNGNMFDLCCLNTYGVEIISFDVLCTSSGGLAYVEVYVATTVNMPYSSIRNTQSSWTLVHQETVTCAASLTVTSAFNLATIPVMIMNGACRGFYVTRTSGSLSYTSGTTGTEGNVYTANADLQFKIGLGRSYPFNSEFSPRIWNGRIHYRAGSTNPTPGPTTNPSISPTTQTQAPSNAPTQPPTLSPSRTPTGATNQPSNAPSFSPSQAPSSSPTQPPSTAPSLTPTLAPSSSPTQPPSTAPSSFPTTDPTIDPTVDPTTDPTHNPTGDTTGPTPAPTDNPTHDPTVDPTQDPTIDPTYTPTQPSNAPSKQPSSSPSRSPSKNPTTVTLFPSTTPTSAPIDPTAAPSPSPTYAVVNCGTNTWCYYLDISPVSGVVTEESIQIQQPYESGASNYEIYITPRGGPCINPTITFDYEQGNIYYSYEYFNIYEDSYLENHLRQQCQGNGGNDYQCGVFWTCVNNLALMSTYITPDTTYNIRIYSSLYNDAYCSGLRINGNFKITCDDTPFTYSPTSQPSLPTANPTTSEPTLSPTTFPTVTLCGKVMDPSSQYCEIVSVFSYLSQSYTWSRSTSHSGLGNDVESTYIYFRATGICYSPHITVTYSPMNTQLLNIYNHYEQGIGQCSSNTACTFAQQDCIRDFDLGLEALQSGDIYVVTIEGNDLANTCGSTDTVNAVVYFMCDRQPTPEPTPNPTAVTSAPSSGAPTSITTNPTPSPTDFTIDGEDLFKIFIVSHWRNDEKSFSLILATFTNEFVDLGFNQLLEYPIDFPFESINSITQLADYSFCFSHHCIQFWNINYEEKSCNIDFSGDFTYQFKASCVGAYTEKKRCLDYLRRNGFVGRFLTSLSTNNFQFADKMCSIQLYQHDFRYTVDFYKDSSFNLKRNSNKYKRGDSAFIELNVLDDAFFDIYEVRITNVFACSTEKTKEVNLTDVEMISGIGGCLLNDYKLPYIIISNGESTANYTSNVLEKQNRFYFSVPGDLDVKKEKLYVQIQATIFVNAARRRRLLQVDGSNQIRHFMTLIDLNAVGYNAAAGITMDVGGGAIAGIVIGVILCFVLLLVVWWVYNSKKKNKDSQVQHNKVKQDVPGSIPKRMEMYKVTSASGDFATAGSDEIAEPPPAYPDAVVNDGDETKDFMD